MADNAHEQWDSAASRDMKPKLSGWLERPGKERFINVENNEGLSSMITAVLLAQVCPTCLNTLPPAPQGEFLSRVTLFFFFYIKRFWVFLFL